MTDGKHTPGPWTALGDGTVRPQGMQFGSLKLGSHWIENAWTDSNADAEVLANAHLVAAAPELLDLLERVHEAESSHIDTRTAWWEARAAAIRKAEGEA